MALRYEIDEHGAAPISVATAKSYLKIGTSADDDIIAMIVDHVTIFAERLTGRELRSNKWFAFDDDFPATGEWELKKNRVETIDSIQYIVDGVATTLANTVYELKQNTLYSCLRLKESQTWPTNVDNVADAILITFTTKADRRRDEVKANMLQHIAFMYENRGDDHHIGNMGTSPIGGIRPMEFYNSVSVPKF